MKLSDAFWLTAPRENFSQCCITKFGYDFNHSDHFIVRSEFIKTGPEKPPVAQIVTQTHQERGNKARQRSASHRVSVKAMASTSNLIQEGRA